MSARLMYVSITDVLYLLGHSLFPFMHRPVFVFLRCTVVAILWLKSDIRTSRYGSLPFSENSEVNVRTDCFFNSLIRLSTSFLHCTTTNMSSIYLQYVEGGGTEEKTLSSTAPM